MGVSLGDEFASKPEEMPEEYRRADPTVELLFAIKQSLDNLPAAIEKAVAKQNTTALHAATVTASQMAREVIANLPTPQVKVDTPNVNVDSDLSEVVEAIEAQRPAATAEEIAAALARVLADRPGRPVKRTVQRDAWGRIESVIEER